MNKILNMRLIKVIKFYLWSSIDRPVLTHGFGTYLIPIIGLNSASSNTPTSSKSNKMQVKMHKNHKPSA